MGSIFWVTYVLIKDGQVQQVGGLQAKICVRGPKIPDSCSVRGCRRQSPGNMCRRVMPWSPLFSASCRGRETVERERSACSSILHPLCGFRTVMMESGRGMLGHPFPISTTNEADRSAVSVATFIVAFSSYINIDAGGSMSSR